MSEPLTKHRATVDLDQFERDLQGGAPFQGGSSYHADDPLAELARLVGEQHDPYGDVFAREAAAPVHVADPFHSPDQFHGSLQQGALHNHRQEPGFDAEPPMSARLSGSFAAIEAGLRGAMDPGRSPAAPEHAEPLFEPAYDQHSGYVDPAAYEAGYDQGTYDQGTYDQAAYDQSGWGAPPQAAAKPRRPLYLVAATIAVGVIGIGTAFALKGHIGTSPREVKTILADSSPTKVHPPADQVADKDAGQDSAGLGKSQPSPTGLSSHEEQPVDVAQAVQDNAVRRADANSVPVPPSPGQIQTAMADPQSAMSNARTPDPIGAASQSFPLSDMPAPKRVRVVSVRPDGSILSDDTPPPAAIPAPRQPAAKTSDKAGPVAKPSTPKSVTKTTSRVTTPKDIAQLAGDDAAAVPAASPAKPVPKKPKPQPQRVASADTGEQEATAAVAPEPVEAGGGGFAVQLAAPGSEADARAASSRLAKKFAGSLGGRRLGFHKADSNGRSVYRVRVSSLSKADAVDLCEKLKADGGSCFVAKN